MTTFLTAARTLFVVTIAVAALATSAQAQSSRRQPRTAGAANRRGRTPGALCARVPGGCAATMMPANGRFPSRVPASRPGRAPVPVYPERAPKTGHPAIAANQSGAAVENRLRSLIAQLNRETARVNQENARAAAATASRPAARAPQPRNTTAGGCETIPVYRTMTAKERRCNDAMVAQIVTGAQVRQLGTLCEQRRAAGPYPGVTRQQQEDARRNGQLADGWYDTVTGPRLSAC